jgi:hypothetical protein
MPLQSSVNTYNTIGFPGNLAFDVPMRAAPFNLVSTPQVNTVGYACTVISGGNPDTVGGSPLAGTAKVGGTGVFAGIIIMPKSYVTSGTGGSALAPTLALPDNTTAELLQEGQIFVSLGTTANIGDLVYYDNTTGALGSVAPTSSFTGVVATNTLTVSAYVAGGAPLGVGSQITGANITQPTFITALDTGTGGNGTYTVTGAATVASSAMTGSAIAPSGKTFISNTRVARYDVAAAGLAVISVGNTSAGA